MGGCIPNKKTRAQIGQTIPLDQLCRYPRTGSVTIRFKNYVGRITNEQVVDFNLTEPKDVKTDTLFINSLKLQISSCVLPGMDVKQKSRYECQDLAFYMSDGQSILLILMDGHGKEGAKVVTYCLKVIENLYDSQKDLQKVKNKQSDPEEFLKLVTKTCDEQLDEKKSGFSSAQSGAAAVLILAFEAVVFSASVGDSRAVLGTQKLPNIFPVPQASTSDRQVLEEIRNRRSSNPDIEIFPLQLTKDQKPNDEEEKKYILSCGGRVQRIVDEFGKMIGPFRVWDKSGNFPGLAMSRSIGDLIAKRLGVISTPIITKYQIKPNDDFFLIIASDGVWDAMENEDAVNFVECFRRKCKNEKVEDEDIVTPHNSCIAQLLAEEARIRWYSIVAEEDVKIDDISVIIVEMNFSEKPVNTGIKKTMNRRTVIQKDTIEGIDYFRAPSIKEVVIGDPKRSSVVGEGPED